MRPKLPTRDRRPFTILLIGSTGACKKEGSAWADPEQAASYGCQQAPKYFTGWVEVAVIETATNEAVLTTSVMI